ncbi:DUF4375 domain-containing protein [Candidatus Sumerlaeota bacterium]|nr:DUF4375 domain-containing protein [Candidatus Sumerlaeota bacterium]
MNFGCRIKWLEGYTGQSTDELIAFEGKYRIDSLILAFEQALDQKAARIGIENLTAEERVVLAIEAFEREVNNGGYSQFFFNSSNEYALIITDALHRIERPMIVKLTQEAINALGLQSVTVAAINRAMENESAELEAELEECDERYYGMGDDLAMPLFEFIKNNKGKIVLINQSQHR